jgi:DNA-binding MarR family transcriptional regulator
MNHGEMMEHWRHKAMVPRRYTLDELLTIKQACPGHLATVMLLLVLAEAPARGMTMGQIAERMSVSTAAMTGLVDSAEELGLVARSAVLGDRRKIAVELTAGAMELLGAAATAGVLNG